MNWYAHVEDVGNDQACVTICIQHEDGPMEKTGFLRLRLSELIDLEQKLEMEVIRVKTRKFSYERRSRLLAR